MSEPVSEPIKRSMYVSFYFTSKTKSGFGGSQFDIEGPMNKELIWNIVEDLRRLLKTEEVVVLSWQPLEA
jgi:hypothetical protein